jgi:hypothetical protein
MDLRKAVDSAVSCRKGFERYDSVTKMEYRAAVEHDIPVYIFVERGAYAEYQTFLRNKDEHDIKYAHVDSVNVFILLEEILAQPRNNPVKEFERYEDIEAWLREQWSGLFKDMLQRTSSQKQLASLQQQVANLAAIGNTLQRYLEAVVEKVSPQRASGLIEEEQLKLQRARQDSTLRQNHLVKCLEHQYKIAPEFSADAIRQARDFKGLGESLSSQAEQRGEELKELICTNVHAQNDVNAARRILRIRPLIQTGHTAALGSKQSKRVRRAKRAIRTQSA